MSSSPIEPPVRFRPRCPRCGGPVESSAPDDWYCREVFCGWEDDEPPFISDRDALAKLYLACINRLSPSERRDAGLTPLLDDIGRYLGVPDDE